jgi:hypothetical protein
MIRTSSAHGIGDKFYTLHTQEATRSTRRKMIALALAQLPAITQT